SARGRRTAGRESRRGRPDRARAQPGRRTLAAGRAPPRYSLRGIGRHCRSAESMDHPACSPGVGLVRKSGLKDQLFDCDRTKRRATMSAVTSGVSVDDLQAFADAWNRHDVEALMSFMTDDCVFEASAGPDVCGTRYVGREAVRAGFAEVWATFPDAHWGAARHFVRGDRGVSEWIFTGTRADGTRVEVHGCDLFTFRDGKIALKDSYRKNRPVI